MVNLHGHAFQYAMAGTAETVPEDGFDSFWTWRERMHELAQTLEPDALQAIAERLYRQMLARGYTTAVEFHYVHHRPSGTRYVPIEAMALALVKAAEASGIRLTLVPVLYERSGFFGQGPTERQRRFVNPVEDFVRLLEALEPYTKDSALRLGVGFHSLRAVRPEAMQEVLQYRTTRMPSVPLHIHAAEQPMEVSECEQSLGARPVAYLLDNFDLDGAWCIVHATHLDDAEVRRLAQSGAVAGLCASTEGNLGDGLFRLSDYLAHGGVFGVGSDSHVVLDPFEELRWLEYGQRCVSGRRAIVRGPTSSVGTNLWAAALEGGRRASGSARGADRARSFGRPRRGLSRGRSAGDTARSPRLRPGRGSALGHRQRTLDREPVLTV
ncbi:MAG: formimidoylglutamate deiminase [Myxococcales bacterium]|nr:formimidoylglutamate deiminase [Myxococcales bacterium]